MVSRKARMFMDAAGTEYKVLPLVWIGGYRTFYRTKRSKWKQYKELPIRICTADAQADLERHGVEMVWTMI